MPSFLSRRRQSASPSPKRKNDQPSTSIPIERITIRDISPPGEEGNGSQTSESTLSPKHVKETMRQKKGKKSFRSRSASPFSRFRRRENNRSSSSIEGDGDRRNSMIDDAKKRNSREDTKESKDPAYASSNDRSRSEARGRKSRRSRSASPFRFRRKEKSATQSTSKEEDVIDVHDVKDKTKHKKKSLLPRSASKREKNRSSGRNKSPRSTPDEGGNERSQPVKIDANAVGKENDQNAAMRTPSSVRRLRGRSEEQRKKPLSIEVGKENEHLNGAITPKSRPSSARNLGRNHGERDPSLTADVSSSSSRGRENSIRSMKSLTPTGRPPSVRRLGEIGDEGRDPPQTFDASRENRMSATPGGMGRRPSPLKRNGSSSGENHKSAKSMGTINSSSSFESIIRYPPSKLIVNNRPPRTKGGSSSSRGSKVKFVFEEQEQVEYPVHGNYYNVLDQLRAALKEKESQQEVHGDDYDERELITGVGRDHPRQRGQYHKNVSNVLGKRDYGPSKKRYNSPTDNHIRERDNSRAARRDSLSESTRIPSSVRVLSSPSTRHNAQQSSNNQQGRVPILSISVPNPSHEPDVTEDRAALATRSSSPASSSSSGSQHRANSPSSSHSPRHNKVASKTTTGTPQRRRRRHHEELVQQQQQQQQQKVRRGQPPKNVSSKKQKRLPSTARSSPRKYKGKATATLAKGNIQKMSSSKSKSIRRLFHKSPPSQHDDRGTKQQPHERRRNFAFMNRSSPARRKVSTASLEKTRAHARRLAMFAGSPEPTANYRNETYDMTDAYHFSHSQGAPHQRRNDISSSGMEGGFDNTNDGGGFGFSTPQKSSGLNFAALDTDSVFSSGTSVYDMDLFDDGSVYSNGSNLSGRKPKSSQKKRSSRSSRKAQQYQNQSQQSSSLDMFGSPSSQLQTSMENAFHPVNMKSKLSTQQQRNFSSQSEASLPVTYVKGNTTSRRQHQIVNRNGQMLNGSIISTGSSVTGAAARRLMRRTLNKAQQNYSGNSGNSGNGSVGSEASESLYSTSAAGLDDSSVDKSRFAFQQGQGGRPPVSPAPVSRPDHDRDRDGNSSRSQFGTPTSSRNTSNGSLEDNAMEAGFTFDAFGLDEHQVDNDVNAAIAELVETNPDFSFFMEPDEGGGGSSNENENEFRSTPIFENRRHHGSRISEYSPAKSTNASEILSTSATPLITNTNGNSKTKVRRGPASHVSQQESVLDRETSDSASLSTKSSSEVQEDRRYGQVPDMFKDPLMQRRPSTSSSSSTSYHQSERSVRERIQANEKENDTTQSTASTTRRLEFQSAPLPDIGSEDSESEDSSTQYMREANGLGDEDDDTSFPNDEFEFNSDAHDNLNSAFMSASVHSSESDFDEIHQQQNQYTGYGDKADSESFPSRGIEQEKQVEAESIVEAKISQDDSDVETSNEEVHFVPRQKNIQSNEAPSESQRRAAAWASERRAPIIVSPLLIPKTSKPKKKTVSQRRAQKWAGEVPRSPNVLDRAPHLKAMERNLSGRDHAGNMQHSEVNLPIPQSYSPQRKGPSLKPSISHHSPLHTMEHVQSDEVSCTDDHEIAEINKHTPRKERAVSGDYEMEEINKQTPRTRRVAKEGGLKIPVPTEKIVLRRTMSPPPQPDYDKYKSAAPTVALRKVQPKSPKKKEEVESPNFLANVKLRKVATPTPRVAKSPTFNNSHDSPGVDEREREQERYAGNYVQNVHSVEGGETEAEHGPLQYNYDLDPSPSDEVDHKFHHPRSTYGNNVKSPARNLHQPAKKEILDVRQEVVTHDRGNHTSGARIISRPPRSSPGSSDPHSNNRYDPSEENQTYTSPVATNKTVTRSHESHPSLNSSPPQPYHREDSPKDTGSAHPAAALFAQRAKSVEESSPSNQSQRDRQNEEQRDPIISESMNPVAALFASRSKEMGNDAEPEPEKDDSPSMHNVAALFAKRSQSFSPTDTESDDKDHKVLNLFAQRSAMTTKESRDTEHESNTAPSNTAPPSAGGNPALKNDPNFTKYFKMLKMGLPMEVVKHALARDGLDPNVMDGDHNKPVGSNDEGVPLKDDPKYTKYFKMLKMGLPLGAVKNAMERDGKDPTVMDGDHDLPAMSGGNKKKDTIAAAPLPKDKYRRTRVHWDTLGQVKSTSVWALVNQDPDVEDIQIDESEFAKLFQAEVGRAAIVVDADQNRKRNAVKVIDPKRANNGGIVLARLKITYEEMAVAIDTINDRVMNIEQVQGILEYIPTKDEKQSLRKYMTSSNQDSADAFDELCECEKFMVAMMTVKHSKEKVRALLFKLQFRQCIADLETDVHTVRKACDELKDSAALRKLLGIVLNIGNRLNTAGPTRKGKAGAFTIESLLKLNQAKAFDKKTTFLHYIVLIVMRHNESLANFKADLPHVLKADKIYWDQIEGDLEEVENQLENVRKIALHEVFGKKRSRRRKKGEDDELSEKSMSLEEEVEALRSTPIGIFTLQAIKIVSALRENVEMTRSKFKKLLEYFGEDERKKMSPHELFEIISVFSKDFDTAKEKVVAVEKEKMRQERRKRSARDNSPSSKSRESRSTDVEDEAARPNVHPEKTETSPRRQSPPRPLRASSMQPHVNVKIMTKKHAVNSVKEDRSTHPRSNGSNDYAAKISSVLDDVRSAQPTQSTESSMTETDHSGLTSNESQTQNRIAEVESDIRRRGASDDSNQENFEPVIQTKQTISKAADQPKPANTWNSPKQEKNDPFVEVRGNSFRSQAEESSFEKVPKTEQSSTTSQQSSMRQRARAMRQERIRSLRQNTERTASSPAQTRRQPPAPGGVRTNYQDVNNSNAANRERLLARRERMRRNLSS